MQILVSSGPALHPEAVMNIIAYYLSRSERVLCLREAGRLAPGSQRAGVHRVLAGETDTTCHDFIAKDT